MTFKRISEVLQDDNLLCTVLNNEFTLVLSKKHEMTEEETEWWGRNCNKIVTRLTNLASSLDSGIAMGIDL